MAERTRSILGRLRPIHRWLSIAVALFWVLQAATGALLVFHWELDDARLGTGAPAVFNAAAIGGALARIEAERPGDRVRSIYATGGVPGRFDLYVSRGDGNTDLVRIDGGGAVLRVSPSNYDPASMSWFRVLSIFHQELFLDDLGTRLVGLSGLLLLTNLLLGLRLGWPRRGHLRAVLLPPRQRSTRAALYAWHRALGLWGAAPALLLVSAGILAAFFTPIRDRFGIDLPEPARVVSVAGVLRADEATRAITTALDQYPGATLSSLRMPRDGHPWYRVRVRRADEWHRVYGMTTLFVAAEDGRVLLEQTPATSPFAVRVFDSVVPVHTGEAAGWVGRVLALLVALWLLAMIPLGIAQWLARRPARRA
jgi:uncharacterized iron-regulated membrane protein